MEHRWGQRIAVKIPVRLAVGPAEFVLGQMTDVSISGAFVQTPRRIPLWTQLEVEAAPRHYQIGRDPERVTAHVARQTGDGVGLEWCDLAPRSVLVLLEAMQVISRRASSRVLD